MIRKIIDCKPGTPIFLSSPPFYDRFPGRFVEEIPTQALLRNLEGLPIFEQQICQI